MVALALEYKGVVTPRATRHLQCKPIKVEFTYDLDLTAADATIEKAIKAEFKKQITLQIAAQVGHLNTWLTEKSALFDQFEALAAKVARNGVPNNPADLADSIKLQQFIQNKMFDMTEQKLKNDFAQIVEDWGTNLAAQQGLIAAGVALKKARATTVANKAGRLRAALVLKAVLVVAAVALGIAATVLSFGTAGPILGALAIAGLSISGISSMARLGKAFSDNWNAEKRVMGKVEEQIEAVEAALGKVKDARGGLPKYLTELETLISARDAQIAETENALLKPRAQAEIYAREIAALKGNGVIPEAEIVKREKLVKSLRAEMNTLMTKAQTLKRSNAEGNALIDKIKGFASDLDQIGRVQPATLLGNIKTRLTTADGLMDIADNVGSLASGVSVL